MSLGFGAILRNSKKQAASGGTLTGANNGLTVSGTIAQQGGTGIQDTTIAWGAFFLAHSYDSIAGGNGYAISAASTLATGNTQKLFSIALSGANANAGQTTYAAFIQNTHTGATSLNVAAFLEASGGATNYALIIPASGGRVGIGTITPIAYFTVDESVTLTNLADANTMIRNVSTLNLNGTAIAGSSRAAFTNYNVKSINLTANQTFASDIALGTIRSILNVDNAAAFTLTMTQGAGGIRAAQANLSVITFTTFNAASVITHLANTTIEGIYAPGITGTVTNYYSILIQDQAQQAATLTITNKWGIYQEGANDKNHFNGQVLIGRTTAPGTGDSVIIRGKNNLIFNYTLYIESNAAAAMFTCENNGRVQLLSTISFGASSQTTVSGFWTFGTTRVSCPVINTWQIGLIGTGTNQASVSAAIAPAPGTGNNTTNGELYFQTPDTLASGATLQTLTTRLTITKDGRLFGSALHDNAGAVTGTTNQYIASGTYTPTLFNTTNVAASTAYLCQWIRTGNVVTVSGKVDIDPTAAAVTLLGMSIPIASNFTAEQNVGGVAATDTAAVENAVRVLADAANDRASFSYTAIGILNNSFSFTFTYLIL